MIRFSLVPYIFCFLGPLFSGAQDTLPTQKNLPRERVTLAGKITDRISSEPLAGASIYFRDARSGAVADDSGNYRFRTIPSGRYLVEVSHLGYTTIVESIILSGDVKKDFLLTRSVAENEGVTITGVSSATLVKRAPVPVTILKKTDLFRNTSTNIIDALSRVPGVNQISSGAAISKPTIRGLGSNRVVVINDGVRQEGQQWGDEHGIEIDEYSVNRIEVLKGPASLMYGSDALAGVINIVSNIPLPENSVKGNVLANYQTNNSLRGFYANVAGNNNGFNWNLYGSYKAAADYKNKFDNRVFNSKFKEKNFGGYIGLNKSWGYSHLLISHFDQKVGLIEGERDSSSGRFLKLVNYNGNEELAFASKPDNKSIDPFIPMQRIKHLKLTSDNSFNVGSGRITTILSFQNNQRMEFGNVIDPPEKELFFDLNTSSYTIQYHFPEKNKWQSSIGINGMNQSNRNKGEEVLIPEYRLFDLGGFIYLKRTTERVTLSGGIRFDNRSLNTDEFKEGGVTRFEHFKKSYSNFSASIGFSYQAGDVIMKLNLAKGFRAPTIPELTSNGAHEGTNRYEYGEKGLHSENSLQVDGGLEMNTEHLSLSANIFWNHLNNFIYYRKLQADNGGDSIITDGTEVFFAFRFDQDAAVIYGTELNLDIHPHPLDWLHIENTFSFVRGKLRNENDGSRNLPFIPAAKIVHEIRGDFLKKRTMIRNMYINMEVENVFSQNHPFTGFNTETRTPGYSLVHAGFGSDVMKKEKILFSVFVSANNIGNVSYQNHLSRLKYAPENPATGRMGVFNMGRNFSFKVNIPFGR